MAPHEPGGGTMGKGDQRTKKGKLFRGTNGKKRPKKKGKKKAEKGRPR